MATIRKNMRRAKQAKRRNARFLVLSLIILITVCLIMVLPVFTDKINKEISLPQGDTVQTSEDSASSGEAEPEKPAKPKKVYNLPPVEEENDLMKIATSAEGSAGRKICYLTFDDGPSKKVTPAVLDILKEYNVKATFFYVGNLLIENRDIAERVHNEGHLIANHSYTHNYKEIYSSPSSFIEDINKNQELINDIIGEEAFKLIRFPGGSTSVSNPEYKKVLKENGYYFVDWNALNGDAEVQLRNADGLLNRVKETSFGDNIVVLMHDANAKTTTPDALGSIIEYLKSKGYEFKKLDEVEYYSNSSPQHQTTSLIL